MDMDNGSVKINSHFFFAFAFALGSAVLLLSTTVVQPAHAWRTDTCDGKLHKGQRKQRTYRLDRCSLPAGSLAEQDVLYGMREWNNVTGMYDRLAWTDGNTTCSITTGDGHWDVAMAASANIDNAWGLRKARYRACVWPYWGSLGGGLRESDILIASDLPFETGDSACDSTEVARRGTIIHEFGHALGLKHDNRAMSVMNNTGTTRGNNHGKYCGPHKDAPHPDELDFAFKYHRSDRTSFDLAASGFFLDANGRRSLTMAAGTTSVCPGDSLDYSFSIANRGTESVTQDNPANWKVVLSTNNIISNFDLDIAFGTVWLTRGGFWVASYSTTIPASAIAGQTYFLGAIVDHDSRFSEYYENNNATYLGRRVRIRNSWEC